MIRSIHLLNFGPYRSEHEIVLAGMRHITVIGPNWSGKSTLIDAILFALSGKTRADCNARDLITHGETSSKVVIEVGDDPSKITRVERRIFGDRTELEVSGFEDARMRDAEKALAEILGLEDAELLSTAFVAQEHVLGLAGLKPAQLRDLTRQWTDRPEWPVLEARAKRALDKLDREVAGLEGATAGPEEDVASLEKELEVLKAEKDEAPKRDKDEIAKVKENLLQIGSELGELEHKGKKLKVELLSDTKRDDLVEERSERDKRLGELEAERKKLRILIDRGFDGRCPVMGKKCPAAGEVEDELESSRANLLREQRDLVASITTLEGEVEEIVTKLDDDDQKAGEVATLRTRWKEIENERLAAVDELDALEHPAPDPEKVKERQRKIGALEERVTATRERNVRRKEGLEKLAMLRKRRAAMSVVHLACSRVGIPAREAAGDLAQVELDASTALGEVGFRVEFRQDRELTAWADQCYACGGVVGGPTCGSCGAARERKRKDELRLIVVWPDGREEPIAGHSGAGKALSGLAVRIAAYLLLRRRRGGAWGTLVLDEVRAAMRPETAKATNSLIRQSLSMGIGQVIDVTHSETGVAEHVLEVVPGALGSSLQWVR